MEESGKGQCIHIQLVFRVKEECGFVTSLAASYVVEVFHIIESVA